MADSFRRDIVTICQYLYEEEQRHRDAYDSREVYDLHEGSLCVIDLLVIAEADVNYILARVNEGKWGDEVVQAVYSKARSIAKQAHQADVTVGPTSDMLAEIARKNPGLRGMDAALNKGIAALNRLESRTQVCRACARLIMADCVSNPRGLPQLVRPNAERIFAALKGMH